MRSRTFAFILYLTPIVIAGGLALTMIGCQQHIERELSKPLPPVNVHRVADDCGKRSAEECTVDPGSLDDGVIRDNDPKSGWPRTEKA